MTPHRRRPLRARNVPTYAQVGGRDVAMQDLTPWTRKRLTGQVILCVNQVPRPVNKARKAIKIVSAAALFHAI